jgi:hypothetical protein
VRHEMRAERGLEMQREQAAKGRIGLEQVQAA